MTNIRTITNSFNSGELSPLIAGRVDQQKYFNSLKTCLNWVPLVQGGIRVRGGFKYAGAAKNNDETCYLFRFIFSRTDSYVLEFGDLYIRFWKYNATTGEPEQIQNGGSPLEVVTPYTEAQVPDLQIVQSADVLFLVHGSHEPARLSRTSETSWTLEDTAFVPPPTYEPNTDLAATLYASAATGTGITFTAGASVFLAADVGRHMQTADNALAIIVGYTSATVVTADILEGSFQLIGDPHASGEWWLLGSPNAVCQPSAAGPVGAVINLSLWTTTAKSVTVNGWRSADVGKHVHILGGTVKITSLTSAIVVTARVISYLLDYTSAVDYAVGGLWTAESETWTTPRGFPSAITLGEQRVLYSGAAGEPDTIRGTITGDYYNFTPGVDDDFALNYVVASEEVNLVQWLHFWRGLVVGTLGSEFVFQGPTNGPLTPSPPIVLSGSNYGSEAIRPIRIGRSLLFVELGARKVRGFAYEWTADSYQATDLTAFADHLTLSATLQRSAYQKTRYSLVWYVRSDGVLPCLTFDDAHQVLGWSRHSSATPDGTSVVMSVAVVPNPVLKRDDLWVSITRSINSSTVRTIEVLDWDRFLDSSIKYSGAATATVTGLGHLEGDEVSIRGKDASGVWRLYPNQTVASNQVTGLSPTVTEAEVGYVITASATTPRLEIQGAGTLQGRIKGFGAMLVRCYDTPVLKIAGVLYKGGSEGKALAAGYSAASVYVIPTGDDAIAPAADESDIELSPGQYDRDGRITFTQDLPVGGTIIMTTAEVDVGR